MIITKEQVAQAIITELENNYNEIDIETVLFKNYNTPSRIVWKSNKEGFYPDIKISQTNGKTNLYEIELTNKINENKWRLFSMFAKLHRGSFYVVIPESMIQKVKAFIADKNFNNIKLLSVPI